MALFLVVDRGNDVSAFFQTGQSLRKAAVGVFHKGASMYCSDQTEQKALKNQISKNDQISEI